MLKRCNFIVDLAIAHARTRRSRYAEKLAELIGRWAADWPMQVDEDEFTTRFDTIGCRRVTRIIIAAQDAHELGRSTT
jgi:hypothetical protein